MSKISIIVPCYNEEAVLYDFYQELTVVMDKLDSDYEVIFINDGSKDRTLEIMKEIAKMQPDITYISFSRNFGKEASMLAGLEYASGDAVVIMDADLQHPPSLIPKLIEKFREGYDQVIAKRTRTGEKVIRSWFSRLFYKMVNVFTDVRLEDGVGDFRLLSKRARNALLSLKEYNRFSKGLFCWIGFKAAVIEYENVMRKAGESAWSFPKLLNYAIDGIISFNNKPLRLSIYLGLIITAFDLLYILMMFIQILIHGIDVPGYFTTISAILFLGGVQLIGLGIIGEYIGRIYCETKRRPHFIIEETNYDQKFERK